LNELPILSVPAAAVWGDIALGQTAARRPVPIARARVLGGGSAVNGMLFMRVRHRRTGGCPDGQ